jgi:hypothetical protein
MALTPLNFPNAPAIGDTWPNPPVTGQPTYTWDGADWISKFALGKAYVPLDGSTAMTGLLTLSGDPTAALQAGTKQYIDGGDNAAIALATGAMQGHLFGLTMSTAGSSTTMTVAPGAACDSTGVRLLKLAAAMAKTTAAWAAGGPAGGLDTGVIAASTWYHWYLIGNPTTGAVDLVFSATATPQNGPTLMPTGFTLFRRIGSMWLNASSQWLLFHQLGDEFLLDAGFPLFSSVVSDTVAHLLAVMVPPNVQGWVLLTGQINGNVEARMYITSPDKADELAGVGNVNVGSYGSASTTAVGAFAISVRTSTSQQIRYRAVAAGSTLYLASAGWIDTRGRLY